MQESGFGSPLQGAVNTTEGCYWIKSYKTAQGLQLDCSLFLPTLANQTQTLCAIRKQEKKAEIFTGTQRLVDVVQEHEKLHAKVTWRHKGLQLNYKKCPRNSTAAMYTEGAGWRGPAGAGKWKRPPGLRLRGGWGSAWGSTWRLIQLIREESSALSFVCWSILPLLSCAGTLSKITWSWQRMS